jgi:hypothetical protein
MEHYVPVEFGSTLHPALLEFKLTRIFINDVPGESGEDE